MIFFDLYTFGGSKPPPYNLIHRLTQASGEREG